MGERGVRFEAEGLNAGTLTHQTIHQQARIYMDGPSNLFKIPLQFTLGFRQNLL
jgi:hypothetical protein